jgi:hypothetical protein
VTTYKVPVTTVDKVRQIKELADIVDKDFTSFETNKSYQSRYNAIKTMYEKAESGSLGHILLGVLLQHFDLNLINQDTGKAYHEDYVL